MAQKPIGYYGTFTPTGVDPTVVQRMEQLAGVAGQVADMAVGFGKAQASADAPEQALADVAKAREEGTETKKKSPFAWGSSEYNQVVAQENAKYERLVTAADLSDRDISGRQSIYDLSITYKDNPSEFALQAETFRKATVTAAPFEIQAQLNSTLSADIFRYQNTISSTVKKEEEKRSINSLRSNLNLSIDSYLMTVQQGQNIEQDLETIYARMNVLSIDDPTFDLAKQKRLLNNSIYNNTALYNLNSNIGENNFKAGYKFIEAFQNKKHPAGYSPDDMRTFTVKAQADIERQKSRLAAEKTVVDKQNKEDVKNYITAVELGMPVDPETRQRINDIVAGTELEEPVKLVEEAAAFPFLPLNERQQILNTAELTGIEGADRYKTLLNANSKINEAVEKDAMSFAYTQDFIPKEDQVGLNISAIISGADKEFFAKRTAQASAITTHTGYPASPLTLNEVKDLSTAIDELTPAEKTNLSLAIGSESTLWGQLSNETNQGVFAQMAALGNPNVMEAVFTGQELESQPKSAFTKITPKDYTNDFNAIVGNIYGPNDASDVLQSAIYHYYSANKGGYDPDKFERSVQAVTGGIGETRGYKVELMPQVTANDLDIYFASLTLENLEAMGADSHPNLADALENGRIVSVGLGQYNLFRTDGKPITNKGDPITFEVNKNKIDDVKFIALTVGKGASRGNLAILGGYRKDPKTGKLTKARNLLTPTYNDNE